MAATYSLTHLLTYSLDLHPLSNRSGDMIAAPVLRHRLHREAPAEAVDPETAVRQA